jgi:hypothetical protein
LPFNLQYGLPLTNPALTTAWRRELAHAAAYTDPNYPEAAGRLDLRTACATTSPGAVASRPSPTTC